MFVIHPPLPVYKHFQLSYVFISLNEALLVLFPQVLCFLEEFFNVVSIQLIKQIFVLTHNAYFHREVSYSYVSKYDYASFYLIRKVNMKSCVKLCDEVNPNEPTERMNINPVKNSYAALWDEYIVSQLRCLFGRSDRIRTCGIDVPNKTIPIFCVIFTTFRCFLVRKRCFRMLLSPLFPRSPNL